MQSLIKPQKLSKKTRAPRVTEDRHSSVEEDEFPARELSADEVAALEAANALRQFDEMRRQVVSGCSASFRLRPSAIAKLNRIAVEGLRNDAGRYRTTPIEISGSDHSPPPADQVDELVEEMCDYVNENWGATPIHLASYVMWRLNWIHPFSDGNGRTSRVVSYLVLCVRLGFELPGVTTIPARISTNKFPYYDALDSADAAFRLGTIDVTAMESLLEQHLAGQLMDVYHAAGGTSDSKD